MKWPQHEQFGRKHDRPRTRLIRSSSIGGTLIDIVCQLKRVLCELHTDSMHRGPLGKNRSTSVLGALIPTAVTVEIELIQNQYRVSIQIWCSPGRSIFIPTTQRNNRSYSMSRPNELDFGSANKGVNEQDTSVLIHLA